MKAIIMAGGFGTRLRPLTINLPKPMVPVMNRPMMEHIVRLLQRHGFTDLTSLLYFHPESIVSYFEDGSAFGVDMKYVKAEADFGTAGSVRNAVGEMGWDERLLIISGDVLTDFDLTEAIKFHAAKKAQATIILTHVKNPLQFGIVMSEAGGQITRFLEKPTWGEVFSDTINTGIYILEPAAYNLIPYKKEFDFSKDLFPQILQAKDPLFGYIAEGYWRDIGNLQEYHEAQMDALRGKVKLDVEVVSEDSPRFPGVDLRGDNVIGKNTTIHPAAIITDSVIGDDCEIGEGAVVDSSIIWRGNKIGRGASLDHVVSCYDVEIGAKAVLNENVFIGDRSQIGARAEVLPNVKLWPEKNVEEGARLHNSLVLEDRWTRALFTNSRISGASNIEITPEFSAKVGASLGAFVGKGQNVVISRDSDPGSRVISRAITSGLMSAGVNVSDLQETPIPLTRHILRGGSQGAGVHIRKNPMEKRRSDLIFFEAGGYDMSTNRTKGIERNFFGEDFPRAAFDEVGEIEFPAHTGESYRRKFSSGLNTDLICRSHFKIAIDYAFGITSTIFPTILGSLGADVVSLNGYLDPKKLTRAREEFERSSKHLMNVVSSLKYMLGFILDSGGERIGLVDEHGELYLNNRLLTLVTKLFFESEKAQGRTVERIAVPISATSEAEEVARSYGAEIIYTKNTHASMMHASSEVGVPFVGGTLGGFIFSDYFFAVDGMFTVAKIMEMLAVLERPLGELAAELPRRAQAKTQVYCPTEQLGTVLRNVMSHTKEMNQVLIDGIKFYPKGDGNSWVLVLPGRERPSCEVIADAATKAEAEALVTEYSKRVLDWRMRS